MKKIELHDCPAHNAKVSDQHCAARIRFAETILSGRPRSLAVVQALDALKEDLSTDDLLSCLTCEHNPQPWSKQQPTARTVKKNHGDSGKLCSRCGQAERHETATKVYAWCLDCYREKAAMKGRDTAWPDDEEYRPCPKCGAPRYLQPDGRWSKLCRQCIADYQRQWKRRKTRRRTQ